MNNILFSLHIQSEMKQRYLHGTLHRIRYHLTQELAVLAANALVSSHLDYMYCNSLFIGLAYFNRHKLQTF